MDELETNLDTEEERSQTADALVFFITYYILKFWLLDEINL